MTKKEAIYILRNAAWLGSNEERQKVEEAVEVVAKAIEAQDMTLYMNLPEVSVEEAIEILKRNSRFELISSGKDINVPSNDTISRKAAIDAIFSEPLYESGMKKRDADAVVPAIYEKIKSLPSAQPELIRCKDCKYSEHWYKDKTRCFLWHETGIDVFKDGYCNYAKRRTDVDMRGEQE